MQFFFVNYTETKSNINMVVYFLVPGDSSWVVLDSNGSSNNSKEGENNFFPVKLYNIFENMILKSFFFHKKNLKALYKKTILIYSAKPWPVPKLMNLLQIIVSDDFKSI